MIALGSTIAARKMASIAYHYMSSSSTGERGSAAIYHDHYYLVRVKIGRHTHRFGFDSERENWRVEFSLQGLQVVGNLLSVDEA